MADANLTIITRAQLTSINTPATNRFAIVLDGQTMELGSTGWRDVSGSLQNVGTITTGMLVVMRTGNVVTIKVSATPTVAGNVQITVSGQSLGASFSPDTILWADGRGGTIGVSTSGVVYINPATVGTKVDATLTFTVDNSWPSALPGVALGQPVVV